MPHIERYVFGKLALGGMFPMRTLFLGTDTVPIVETHEQWVCDMHHSIRLPNIFFDPGAMFYFSIPSPSGQRMEIQPSSKSFFG